MDDVPRKTFDLSLSCPRFFFVLRKNSSAKELSSHSSFEVVTIPMSQPNSLSFKLFKPLLVSHCSKALSKAKIYVRVKQYKFSMVIGKDIRF